MMRRPWSLLLLLLLLAGCGYHRPGEGDSLGAISTLRIQLFANRTYEPFLENVLTNAVTQRFQRTRSWRLVEEPAVADAVFSGTVVSFQSTPVSFDANDKVLEYRAQMTVAGELRRQEDGRVLWKGSVTWNEEYPGGLDKGLQDDNKGAAIRLIAARLAEEFYFRVTDNF